MMTAQSLNPLTSGSEPLAELYERDFCLWLELNIQQMKAGTLEAIDVIHVIEELETMGRSERQSLQSNLQVVLMHLLKYKYQSEKRTKSWRFTLLEHRDRIEVLLEDSPSLRTYLSENFVRSYAKARKKAAVETDLDIEIFPLNSPFTIEETLDSDYLPE
jgi:hypothetical protein